MHLHWTPLLQTKLDCHLYSSTEHCRQKWIVTAFKWVPCQLIAQLNRRSRVICEVPSVLVTHSQGQPSAWSDHHFSQKVHHPSMMMMMVATPMMMILIFKGGRANGERPDGERAAKAAIVFSSTMCCVLVYLCTCVLCTCGLCNCVLLYCVLCTVNFAFINNFTMFQCTVMLVRLENWTLFLIEFYCESGGIIFQSIVLVNCKVARAWLLNFTSHCLINVRPEAQCPQVSSLTLTKVHQPP